MKQCLEEELKSRKDLEKLVRRLLKQTDECSREEQVADGKLQVLQGCLVFFEGGVFLGQLFVCGS